MRYNEIVNATDKHGNVQFEYTPLGKPTKRKQNGTELRLLYDTEQRYNVCSKRSRAALFLSLQQTGGAYR